MVCELDPISEVILIMTNWNEEAYLNKFKSLFNKILEYFHTYKSPLESIYGKKIEMVFSYKLADFDFYRIISPIYNSLCTFCFVHFVKIENIINLYKKLKFIFSIFIVKPIYKFLDFYSKLYSVFLKRYKYIDLFSAYKENSDLNLNFTIFLNHTISYKNEREKSFYLNKI